MTVTASLPNGKTDKYMRSDDAYIKHGDGTLDIVRSGAQHTRRLAAEEWADVEGDESRWKKGRFRGLA